MEPFKLRAPVSCAWCAETGRRKQLQSNVSSSSTSLLYCRFISAASATNPLTDSSGKWQQQWHRDKTFISVFCCQSHSVKSFKSPDRSCQKLQLHLYRQIYWFLCRGDNWWYWAQLGREIIFYLKTQAEHRGQTEPYCNDSVWVISWNHGNYFPTHHYRANSDRELVKTCHSAGFPHETQGWLENTQEPQDDYLLPQASQYAWRIPKQWPPHGCSSNIQLSHSLIKCTVLSNNSLTPTYETINSNQCFLCCCKLHLQYMFCISSSILIFSMWSRPWFFFFPTQAWLQGRKCWLLEAPWWFTW